MAELMLGSDEDQAPSLGFAGDTMNTAIYLNRMLGETSEVSYISVVGEDALSDRLIRRLNDESVNTSRIRRSSERLVGLYAITTDQSGERSFSYWRSESAARTLFQEGSEEQQYNFDVLSGFDVIFLSAISLAILPNAVRVALLAELARLRSEEHVNVVFDSNYRPALWESAGVARETIAATWRITDIALPSIDDEKMLFNDVDEAALLARFRAYGVVKGALKRGELGPRSLNGSVDQSIHESLAQKAAPPACELKVVDTTAAGDSFNAGYLSSILNGKDEQDALQAGHACACRVISHRGAIIPRDQW
ncbi:MAG: sugar kinase [Gammaproteobacteria bacterium]|nr:sugar kinase [Gammaproteobacteria bacterium]